jgi:hypothetical protein
VGEPLLDARPVLAGERIEAIGIVRDEEGLLPGLLESLAERGGDVHPPLGIDGIFEAPSKNHGDQLPTFPHDYPLGGYCIGEGKGVKAIQDIFRRKISL